MFNIIIDSEPTLNEWNEIVVNSKIIINEFSEDFFLPISYWNISDYKYYWKESIGHMIMGNKEKAILPISMYERGSTNFIHSWIIYRYGIKAIIQNKILFKEDYDLFSIEEIMGCIPDREIYSECGQKISEWSVGMNEIVDFYNNLVY